MSLLKVSLFSILSALSFVSAPQPAYGAAPPQDSYQVQPGDSLWKIAARTQVYGTPWKWPLIYDANRRIIDPELIEVGWTLSLPLAPTQEEVMVAMEQARQYEGRGELPPPVEGMSLADIRVMDDTLPAPLTAKTTVDPNLIMLVVGAFVLAGLAIMVWKQKAEPQVLVPLPVPQPTESEEIVRAMDGQDPPKPLWGVAANGDLIREEDREKMAA